MRDVTVVELTSATATMSGRIVPKPPKAPESENFNAGFYPAVIRSQKESGIMLPG